MEGETEEELRARTERKVKKAAQLLFFRQHRIPGVKGWELKKALGDDYMEGIGIISSTNAPGPLHRQTYPQALLSEKAK